MVTGDLNAAHVEWVVQYEISDPEQFLFNNRDPGLTLRDLSESVMREVVGDRTVDEVLTIGRQGIENESIQKLTTIVQELHMGLRIQQVQLKNVHPPTPVQKSFDEVNRAQQEREQMINLAAGEYNKVVPRASGEAEQRLVRPRAMLSSESTKPKVMSHDSKRLLSSMKKLPKLLVKDFILKRYPM